MDFTRLFRHSGRGNMYLSIQVGCTFPRVSTVVEAPTRKAFLAQSVAFLFISCAYIPLAHLRCTAFHGAGKLRAGRSTVQACLGH